MKGRNTRWKVGILAAILIAALAWSYHQWIDPKGGDQWDSTEPPAFTGITSPRNLDVVSMPVTVHGVYDPPDVEGGHLWLFIKAPDGRYYPQVTNACRKTVSASTWTRLFCSCFPQVASICEPASSIVIEAGHFDWEMTAALGPTMDSGTTFELVLGAVAPSVSFQIFGVFPVWCSGSGIAGFDYSQMYGAFRFKELDRVVVTRK